MVGCKYILCILCNIKKNRGVQMQMHDDVGLFFFSIV